MGYLQLHVFMTAAFIAHHVMIVKSCTCRQPDLFDEICNRDVTIQAKVVSVTYPGGKPDRDYEYYDVHYELEIEEIFHAGEDFSTIPNILESFGPGALCGLVLGVGDTYILSADIANSTINPGGQVLGMYLCSLYYLIGRDWGLSLEEVDALINAIDCSDPTSLYSEVNSQRRNVMQRFGKDQTEIAAPAKTTRQRVSIDLFKAFMSKLSRREMADSI